MILTKEELAARLNKRQRDQEITEEEKEWAKLSGLLVIYGSSDDLIELAGVIDDELECIDEQSFYITADNKLMPEIDSDDEQVLKKYDVLSVVYRRQAESRKITALWCYDDKDGFSWAYETKMDHATFDIFDGDENEYDNRYCRGIIVDLSQKVQL